MLHLDSHFNKSRAREPQDVSKPFESAFFDREEEVETSRPVTHFNVCIFTSKSGETTDIDTIECHQGLLIQSP